MARTHTQTLSILMELQLPIWIRTFLKIFSLPLVLVCIFRLQRAASYLLSICFISCCSSQSGSFCPSTAGWCCLRLRQFTWSSTWSARKDPISGTAADLLHHSEVTTTSSTFLCRWCRTKHLKSLNFMLQRADRSVVVYWFMMVFVCDNVKTYCVQCC